MRVIIGLDVDTNEKTILNAEQICSAAIWRHSSDVGIEFHMSNACVVRLRVKNDNPEEAYIKVLHLMKGLHNVKAI